MRFKKKQKKSLEAVDGEKFLLPHIRMKFHLFGWREIRALGREKKPTLFTCYTF